MKFEPGDVIVPKDRVSARLRGLQGIVSQSPNGVGWYVWGKCRAGWISPIDISNTVGQYRLATNEERDGILWAMVGVSFFDPEGGLQTEKKRARWKDVIEGVVKPTIKSYNR